MSYKLAIVVSYRDRQDNLNKFIPHMDEFLKDIDYKIYVIEQSPEKPFNRGKLLNIGFKHATEDGFETVVFHDVDMLPIISDYSYCSSPTHLVGFATQFHGKIPYNEYFGGVTLFDKESFIKINGYHNEYWGWGGEDDDLWHRCIAEGIMPVRKPGNYLSLAHIATGPNHPNHKANEWMANQMRAREIDYKTIGLNSLKYEMIGEEELTINVKKITVKI